MFMPSIFGKDFLDDFFGYYPADRTSSKVYRMTTAEAMKTDVRETEGGYELEMDLPGYGKENVKAELKDGYMTITAEKNEEKEEKDKEGKYIHRERYSGSCSRSFYVGENVTENDIQAKFENGILKMFVPKLEAKPIEEQTKRIAITG